MKKPLESLFSLCCFYGCMCVCLFIDLKIILNSAQFFQSDLELSEGIFSREPFGQCKFFNLATFYSSDALNSQGQDMKIYVCVILYVNV